MSKPLCLKDIEKRLENITPGPWVRISGMCPIVITESNHCAEDFPTERHDPLDDGFNIWNVTICRAPGEHSKFADLTRADLDFIAHAREDVPALIEEVKSLRGRLGEMERLLAEERGSK